MQEVVFARGIRTEDDSFFEKLLSIHAQFIVIPLGSTQWPTPQVFLCELIGAFSLGCGLVDCRK